MTSNQRTLLATAHALVENDKGIFALDVSNATCNKRYAALCQEVGMVPIVEPEVLKSRAPWALAFSFGRAIQQPAMEIWSGKESNVAAAQGALLHRARCNYSARKGDYFPTMETDSP